MRVMSFNIRGALFDDGVNRWPNRADLNIHTIARHAPDLIGFQELHQGNYDVYRERLTGYAFSLGPPYNDSEPHYQYPAIFWNPGRLTCLETGGFWISETPERHSGSWGTACIRSAAWARFALADTGDTFLHLNTHLDHVSELARAEGARLIARRLGELADPDWPIVVSGDFNCMPGTAAHQAFTERAYVDACQRAGQASPAYSFHNYQGRDYQPKPHETDRIDWILLRDGRKRWSVASCALIYDAEPPLYPSDHFPLLADLALAAT